MVALTGIKSRFVVAAGGGILVVLGLLPVLGRIMNAISQPVLGGAGIVLFGSVAAAGIRTLSRVNFTNSNVLIVAASIGVGIIPITVPERSTTTFPSGWRRSSSPGSARRRSSRCC
jgi:NCS2 family nucleobase:cation symporter-2